MEKANTPLEQICFNTKDIKKLKQQIAPLYKSSVNLSDNADVVDVADTNLTADIEKAFIIDPNGNFYKFIAFNEDKTKAYIEYYASIKGEKGDTGETGATGADGQNGLSVRLYNGNYINTSSSYTKSSLADSANLQVGDIVIFKNGYLAKINTITTTTFKVNNQELIEIEATTKGAFIAFSQPTENGDFLVYAPTAIYNKTANTQFATGDLIIYIDSNDNPTEIYLITGFSGDNLIVEKKAEYAKGKQLYQHNIVISGSALSQELCVMLQITDDKNLPYVKANEYVAGTNQNLFQFLIDLGLNGSSFDKIYPATVVYYGSYQFAGLGCDGSYFTTYYKLGDSSQGIGGTTVKDIIKPI